MKIFIAGGAGFVGTHLTKRILETSPKNDVIVYDNLSNSSIERTAAFSEMKRYTFIEGDITDRKETEDVLNELQPDVVINATYTTEERKAPAVFNFGNVVLLNAIKFMTEKKPLYIFLSSNEVYGDIDSDIIGKRHTEEDGFTPRTIIAAQQAGADLTTSSYHTQYGIPTVIVRISNIFGPMQSEDRMIPKIITAAINNKDIKLYGDGSQSRDWLYIDDAINFLITLLSTNENIAGEIYNISGLLEHSYMEVAEHILTVLNKPRELISLTDDTPLSKRSLLDATKAHETFDWEPVTDFNKALELTLEWFQENNS